MWRLVGHYVLQSGGWLTELVRKVMLQRGLIFSLRASYTPCIETCRHSAAFTHLIINGSLKIKGTIETSAAFVWDRGELRRLAAWGMKLLCSLVLQQQMLMYLLSDGSITFVLCCSTRVSAVPAETFHLEVQMSTCCRCLKKSLGYDQSHEWLFQVSAGS